MGYVSTWMGDLLSALLVSLMALRLMQVDQNHFWPCYILILHFSNQMSLFQMSQFHENPHQWQMLKAYPSGTLAVVWYLCCLSLRKRVLYQPLFKSGAFLVSTFI